MAIGTVSYPVDFSPAYNPMEFVFSSTNVSNCDFQFIVDLYINGSFAIRLKAFPEGDNDYGYFRIEKIIQDYLSYNFHDSLVGFAQNKQSICSYYLEVRERYNSSSSCTGSSTLSAILLTTGTRYAFNMALSFFEKPYFMINNYAAYHDGSKFLTKSPSRIIINSEQEYNLYFMQNPSGPVDDIVVRTFNRFGTLLKVGIIENTFKLSSPDVPEDYHLAVGVGPEQLNLATLSTGTQPLYHEDVHYYEVWLRDSATAQISERKQFQIDDRCSGYEPYQICWLNRYGGVDYYTFPLKRTRNVTIAKTLFEKVLAAGYSLDDRGQAIARVDANETFIFTSNWLTEEEGLWLEELFTSPEVFYRRPADTQTFSITGAAHRAADNTADFVLAAGVSIPAGTPFTFTVDDGSPIGMANSGSGVFQGIDSSTGYHKTNVTSTISAGAVITGSLIAEIVPQARIGLVITNTSYEEKLKSSVRNIQYTIEARPSNKINVQSQ